MQDFEGDLVTLLSEKWSLTGDLVKGNIDFHRGLKEPQDIVKPQVVVQHSKLGQAPQGASAESLSGFDSEIVVIQVKAKSKKLSHVEEAKANKWLMMMEVDRIQRKEAKPDGWIESYVLSGDCFDSLSYDPPIMEERLVVRIQYQV